MALKVKLRLLYYLAQKAVFKALCIEVVNLCDDSELNEVHHNILDSSEIAD